MPKKRREPEAIYYEPIRRYLKAKMGCVVESFTSDQESFPFIRRGFRRLVVDVYGLKGFRDRNSRGVEGVAVEVKRSRERTALRHLIQAHQYSRLAHRCFLAQPRDFDRDTMLEASRLGIGLLKITRRKIDVVAESRRFDPDPEMFSTFLHHSLRIIRCALCNCYRFRYQNIDSSSRVGKGKGGHYRQDQIAPGGRERVNKKVYFCDKCQDLLSAKNETNKLHKRLRRLERKLRRIELRLSK